MPPVIEVFVSVMMRNDFFSFLLARNARSLEQDGMDRLMKKMAEKFKPFFDDDDEEEEEAAKEDATVDSDELPKKTIIQANVDLEKSEEVEGNSDDQEADSSQYIDADEGKAADKSDES